MSTTHHQPVQHPTPVQYVKIAFVLAGLTGVEVGLYYLEKSVGRLVVPALLVLAVLKFVIVVGWYMHMRFERSTIARFFSAGITLALLLYAVVLGTFGVIAVHAG